MPQLARLALIGLLVVALTVLGRSAAQAQSMALIRDAEIEATLRAMTNPILEVAGLGADSVRIYIVEDSRLNAFVAGGMNLFINTGLIMRSENPGQLLGVIAHEVGHIAGGHLTRIVTAQERAAAEMIVATVLGAATALAGAPQLGTAIIGGGQALAQSGLLKFSRTQEQSADQAALTYLDEVQVSASGLAEFFRILDSQSALVVSRQEQWATTHPLSRDRINFVEGHVAREPEGLSAPPAWREAHARAVAKLQGFLSQPREVLRRYEQDDSVPGRYARAIALYRVPDLNGALAGIGGLIRDYPDDPYFHELEGQILFENGRVADSIGPYRESVRLRPDSALLKIGLAQSLIELGSDDATAEAMVQLQEALGREPTNATAWRLLGIAQGRAGLEGPSFLSFAEYALLLGRKDDAQLYVSRAEARMDGNDPGWLRLQDVKRALESN